MTAKRKTPQQASPLPHETTLRPTVRKRTTGAYAIFEQVCNFCAFAYFLTTCKRPPNVQRILELLDFQSIVEE